MFGTGAFAFVPGGTFICQKGSITAQGELDSCWLIEIHRQHHFVHIPAYISTLELAAFEFHMLLQQMFCCAKKERDIVFSTLATCIRPSP